MAVMRALKQVMDGTVGGCLRPVVHL
ncbi:Hypothetical protein GQ85_014 [Rhodococcus rhodochrous]|nr:hypothetical protein KTR9_5086 [Gordonia sp. KTR9]ART90632.1 hypothetical protein [Rhodococcus rhodochrous]OOL33118.1 Hypothetical protein GQ85_014 [Rhodococcus rhodochrous]